MAHDIIESIRSKVRQAEELPVAWQKDRVWQMISLKAEASPRRSVFYYYAAASLFIILSAISFVVQRYHQEELNVRITSLETSVSKAERPGPKQKEVTAASPVCPKEDHHQVFSSRRIDLTQRPSKADNVMLAMREVKKDPVEITVKSETPVIKAPASALSDTADAPRQVTAILGFIPTPAKMIAKAKTKTRTAKFHLFKSPETEPGVFSEEENKLLTARIN